jgi:hypothetical protein
LLAVLSDINMPGMDAQQSFSETSRTGFLTLPGMMVTAYRDVE